MNLNLFDDKYINKLKSNRDWDCSFGAKYHDDPRYINHKTQLEKWFRNVHKKRKNEITRNRWCG